MRKAPVLIVTDALPGWDAAFAHAGHAVYLASFIDHFAGQGRDVVVVAVRPRPRARRIPLAALRYRVVSSALRRDGDALVATSLRTVATTLAWRGFERAPRSVQALLAAVRDRARRSAGYAHVLGTFPSQSEVAFVRAAIAAERPAVVLYDGLFACCGRVTNAATWVITHDVKHLRAQSFAERGVAVLPHDLTCERERRILREADGIVAIQWDDAAEFARMLPDARVVVVPVALAPPAPSASVEITGRCLFVGSGSYHNVDGLRWFLDACWPALRAAVPAATLDVVGTVGQRIGRVPAGVRVTGPLDDLATVYHRAALAVVPLRIGSGLKVKLAEALSFGKAIVTTGVGAQGLLGFAPRPFVVADEAAAFAKACAEVLSDDARRERLVASARQAAVRFTAEAAFAQFAAATAPALELRAS